MSSIRWCAGLRLIMAVGWLCSAAILSAEQTDEVYSGPQPGESLPALPVRVVFGKETDVDQTLDVIERAGEGPVTLVIVHEVTRPSIGLTRIVANYAASHAARGMTTGVIFLSSDPTETENWMRRARHALPEKVLLGIATDGAEGPGAYGLNRNVALTVLVGNAGKVTENFALIQPSLQADAVRIAAAIAKVVGLAESAPTLEQLLASAGGDRMNQGDDASLRELLQPLLRRDATAEQVADAAARVEQQLASDARLRVRVGQAAQRIATSGKLENYGTPAAQAILSRWAKEYAVQP